MKQRSASEYALCESGGRTPQAVHLIYCILILRLQKQVQGMLAAGRNLACEAASESASKNCHLCY